MRAFFVLFVTVMAAVFPAKAATQSNVTTIAQAARSQIGKTVKYDPAYRTLDYPNGDVPMETGVCADVVVRALRQGPRLDLQKLVHEDMKQNFSSYPSKWGLAAPDKNIDHRRVLNLQVYFARSGWELPISKTAQDYRPGDLVACTVPPNLPHIMVVSDHTNSVGRPLVIHNIGSGTQEEDMLFAFKITGHYRVKRAEPPGPVKNNPSTGSVTNRRPSMATSNSRTRN
jgi:uncharacterized protein YijF (DUF1287 family)